MERNRLALSLYWKLVLALLVLLGALAAAFLFLTVRTSKLYFTEVNQRLNRGVASHIAKERAPFQGSEVDQDALKAVFMDIMKTNPTLEAYFLDAAGQILKYDAPPEKIVRQKVGLGPIREFLRGDEATTVLGDDPRSADGRKAFSVHAFQDRGAVRGYLYIILGGEEYESAAALFRGSYILRGSAWVGLAALAAAGLLGLAVVWVVIRPVRALRATMDAFQRNQLDARVTALSNDEIGALGRAFNRMADRIVAQMRSLRRTDRQRREMVANISHDLRTPVASLQGYLETTLLKNEQLGAEERRGYLEVALRNTKKLSKLVDELFELARFDAGEVRLRVERFSLAELAQDVVQKLKLQAEEKDLRLVLNASPELPDVRGDIGLIERVLDNLLENAIHYTPAGGRIELRLVEQPGAVEIRVTDNGRGIPKADLPQIFERFYRVEKSRTDQDGGTGLGLAISKRILDLHKSPIRVRSRENVGTSFSFVLAA